MSLSDTPPVPATAPVRPLRTWTLRGRSAIMLAGVSAVCGIGLAASGMMLMRAAGGAGMLDVIGGTQPKPHVRSASAPTAALPAAAPPAAKQPARPEAAETGPTPPAGAVASAPPAIVSPMAPAATVGADPSSPGPAGPTAAASSAAEAGPVGPAAPATGTSAPAKAASAALPNEVAHASPVRPATAARGEAARRITATPAPNSPARTAATDEALVPVKPLRTPRRAVAARAEPVEAERRDPAGLRAIPAPAGTAPNVRAYTLADRTSTPDPSGARIIRLDLPATR